MNERLIRQRAFFFGFVAILAVLALILVWQYVKAILLAVALVIVLKPLYTWFLSRKWVKGSERRANALTLASFILLIAIPTTFIISGAISQASQLFSGAELEGLDFSIRGIIAWLESLIQGIGSGMIEIDEIQLSEGISRVLAGFGDWATAVLINLGRAIPGFFVNALVVLVILYVALPRYKRPGKQDILEIVPFPPEITQLFLDKIDLMIKAMFKGTFVIAIVQGLAMGLVLLIAGVPFVLFLTLLSMLLSLVPLIGISLVAWPVGIFLIISGSVWQGVFVIAAFLIIVANIDTVLRPILIPKGAQLNQALVILSVFGGLGLMGIIGALYGPVVMILLVTSIDVYTKYMLRADLETLDKQGRIDLKELGLVSGDDQKGQTMGQMFYNVLKNVSAPFRREAPQPEGDTSPFDGQARSDNPAPGKP
ncbi:MAG: AI-2E family transporter [Anaerolineales bacterium]|jgi:predicted PurR-regulated permease PerM